MTYQAVDTETVRRAICDGPGCGLGQLFESTDEADVPSGWSRMGIGGGYRIFDSLTCARAWLRSLTVEARDGSGWQLIYTDDLHEYVR